MLLLATAGLGFGCLWLAWRADLHLRQIENRADGVVREVYGVTGRVRDLDRELKSRLPAAQVAVRRRLGRMRFEPEMPVLLALLTHPDAALVLTLPPSSAGCGPSLPGPEEESESLRAYLESRGKDVTMTLQQLNGLLDGSTRLLPKTAAGFVSVSSILRKATRQGPSLKNDAARE